MAKTTKKQAASHKTSKSSNKSSVFTLISDIGQVVLLILLIAAAVAGFGSRIPVLAQQGLQFYGVTSGSMEPALPVGSLIKVGKYQIDELSQGDIITYTVPSPNSDQPNIVTHRIAEVKKEESVKTVGEGDQAVEQQVVSYQFITKGDANNKTDDYVVKANDILGKYEGHLPYLGYISAYSQTSTGFILMVIVPAVILIVWEVISLVTHFKQRSLAESEAEIKRLKQELAEKSKQP